MDIIDCLMKIGFTKHESILYVTLCREGELTGYEAAKISGIPRSNAYLALAGLVEKGGAAKIESEVIKYIAVSAMELTANNRRKLNQVLDYIETNTPVKDIPTDPFITITGKTHIVNKMKNIIESSKERVYLSISSKELEYVRREIIDAEKRGLKVVIITSEPFEIEGIVTYYNEKQPGQIRLIADTSHVLTGEVIDDGECTSLYSQNKNLIQLIKDSLTNEIKLIRMQQ